MIELHIKKLSLLAIICLIIPLSSISNIVTSAENIKFEELAITVPSSEPKIRYNLNVWVLGVWQYVNITLNDYSDEIAIVFYYGTIIADENDRDETNYYFWRYKQGNWNDEFHGSKYIKKDLCSYSNNTYSFYIGIDQYSFSGNWTLRFYSETQQIHVEEIFAARQESDGTTYEIPIEEYPIFYGY